MIIDTANDHNTKETARRVAKMYVDEVFKGRYHPMPKVTDFPNAKELDEIYTLPITVRSACSHHFVPIVGQAWIGIVPSDRVIGISKFNRIVDWVMSRPHIQEEAAIMVADTIEDLIKPKGLAFVIKAQHMCMTWRGVKEPETKMVNSIVRGSFRQDPSMKKNSLILFAPTALATHKVLLKSKGINRTMCRLCPLGFNLLWLASIVIGSRIYIEDNEKLAEAIF